MSSASRFAWTLKCKIGGPGKPAASVKQPVSKPAATTNRFAALTLSSDSDDDEEIET